MNGGLLDASTNSCDAGSRTTGACVLTTVMCIPFSMTDGSDSRGHRRGFEDHLGRGLGVRDGGRVRRAGNLQHAARVGALGHEALEGRGDVAVLLADYEPRR